LDTRLKQLNTWLETYFGTADFGLTIASADASFRRYFRIKKGNDSFIAMDAPPDKEDSTEFSRIAKNLIALGVHAPTIHQQDLALGFLLLEDLGSVDYLDALKRDRDTDALYHQAIKALLLLQNGEASLAKPYSIDKLREEMALFPTWYLGQHLRHTLTPQQTEIWEQTQTFLCDVCTQQPQVWVHRDFHSRNLMVTQDNSPGVIDFQDLVLGPIAYDLASIFKDCYIEWPRDRQLNWLADYYHLLNPSNFDLAQLVEWYDLTGLQRHLKVLGIFCRLNYRDEKPRYLADLPLVANYCLEVLHLYANRFSVINNFNQAFSSKIKQAL